jgi:hypothetical protein
MRTTSETIELDVQLTERDYMLANYWYLFRNWSVRSLIPIASILLGVSIFLWIRNPRGIPWIGFLLPAILIAMLISVYFGSKRSMASNKSLQALIHYRFTRDEIEAIASSSSGRTSWENIYAAHEAGRNFLIFISRNQMYTIPKRCFDHEEQIASFRTLLRDRLGERAHLRAA